MHAAASFYCQQWAAKASTGQPDCAACLSRSGGEKFLGNFRKDSIASDSKARLAGQIAQYKVRRVSLERKKIVGGPRSRGADVGAATGNTISLSRLLAAKKKQV